LETYAINLNPVVSLRAQPDHRSEQTSQLLFGEMCRILDSRNSHCYICNDSDDYLGWVYEPLLTHLSSEDFSARKTMPKMLACQPVAAFKERYSGKTIYLPAGSNLTGLKNDFFEGYDTENQIKCVQTADTENLLPTAFSFLGAPYQWGGKTVWGIDCSGFVQVICALCGYLLPRDAAQQALACTSAIADIEEAETGDLLYFSENEKIIHTGIFFISKENGTPRVIHASGKVKIDIIDPQGIYDIGQQKYTHTLHSIHRP
jgi:hypothetical protein